MNSPTVIKTLQKTKLNSMYDYISDTYTQNPFIFNLMDMADNRYRKVFVKLHRSYEFDNVAFVYQLLIMIEDDLQNLSEYVKVLDKYFYIVEL